MKKLFFFRSSAFSSGNNNHVPQGVNDQATDKPRNSFRSPRGSSKPQKQVLESQTSGSSPCLRRSLSLSSATLHEGGLGQKNSSCFSNRNGSPCSNSNISLKRSDHHSSRCKNAAHVVEKPSSVSSSRGHKDSTESSSYCSSNVSNKVVDRYIDGEQEQEKSAPKSISSQRNHIKNENGNGAGKHPSRAQFTAPSSPPKSHSFRETKGTQLHFFSRDWVENGFEHESPRRLAKHVIERLSQTRVLPKTSSKAFDRDIPITIEDIYGRSLNKCPSLDADGVAQKSCPQDGPDETTSVYHHKEISAFEKRNCFPRDNYGVLNSVEAEEDIYVELLRKSKEAEERVLLLLEELEQEDFLEDSGFSMPALIQTIRNLTEERVSMAHEVSAVLQTQIAERASAREEFMMVRAELDSQTRRLEKKKNELQSALEKELDRRSDDWSIKLEKYQAEEHRLRERVRELAEHNVSLQRDVSSLSEREMESRSRIACSELQLQDLTTRVEDVSEENQNLRQNLSELQEKHRAAEEDRDCIQRNYEENVKECKELHRSITRLLRTCSEQEKTIDGLREGLSEEVGKKSSLENFDKQLGKLQMEQIRLTGVEQALRKEVRSYRLEVDFLRHENIYLLHRLKFSEKEGGFSTFKLDQELLNRAWCMQNQGLSLLNDSTQLCSKLLEYIKVKAGQTPQTKQGIESIKNGLDGQFLVESDMKVQGFKRGTESLTKGLQTISAVLDEKSNPVVDSHSHCLEDGSGQLLDQSSEDIVRSELKVETLLTSLLREKLYSKEVDVEQLQAELAAAVRVNDILSCEVQTALDNLSCMTHKMKDLELRMIKKDENINQLQNDLHGCSKELSIVRGILPKVSEERDLMRKEVRQYSERNMLLNSEVNVLKKKIEALDEDILLKGQITILKGTTTICKPFDFFGSPGMLEFNFGYND